MVGEKEILEKKSVKCFSLNGKEFIPSPLIINHRDSFETSIF